MRPTCIALIAVLASAGAASAQDECRTLFTDLYAHDAGRDYPLAVATTRTAPNGDETVIRNVLVARDHVYATLEDGTMMRTQGLEQAVSQDGGETWKVGRTLPEGHWERYEEMQAKVADGAMNVTCSEDVELFGKTYREVEGEMVVQSPVPNLNIHQSYYLEDGGDIAVIETELTANGQSAHSIEIVTARGEEVTIPGQE